jgi:hypothetical protein
MEVYMKILILFLLITLLPDRSRSQNIPACDSLVIECCSFEVDQNTVSLIASNYLSYLFDYPGFILYNSEMDTVAIETVNYFGISTQQPHALDIIHPFSLPFNGILELYVLFYDSLTCTFEVTIPDTITTALQDTEFTELSIFPNPAGSCINIEFRSLKPLHDYNLKIVNGLGQEVLNCRSIQNGMQIPAGLIGEAGMYFLHITDPNGNIIETRKLLIK